MLRFSVTDQYTLQMGKSRMFSVSHKTVFVVDHCPYMAESSRQQVECDVLTKSRAQGVIPLAPVSKSLWTCAVECSMEYCRILYDIYPRDKLVSFNSDWTVVEKYFSLFCFTTTVFIEVTQFNKCEFGHLSFSQCAPMMSMLPLTFYATCIFCRLIILSVIQSSTS